MRVALVWWLLLVAVATAQTEKQKVVFVGYTNTFYGSVHAHGFVKLYQAETTNTTEVSTLALPYSSSSELASMIQHEDVAQLNYDKVFLVVEADAVLAEYDEATVGDFFSKPVSFPNPSLALVESLLASLKSRSKDLVLCVLLLSGESSGTDTRMDKHFDSWRTALKRVSEDYFVSFVDFSLQLAKFGEVGNLDDLDHSILTHEGNILNERGDTVIAHELLRHIGVQSLSGAVARSLRSVLPKESLRDDVNKMRSPFL